MVVSAGHYLAMGHPIGVLMALSFITSLLANLMSHTATAALMAPIAMKVCAAESMKLVFFGQNFPWEVMLIFKWLEASWNASLPQPGSWRQLPLSWCSLPTLPLQLPLLHQQISWSRVPGQNSLGQRHEMTTMTTFHSVVSEVWAHMSSRITLSLVLLYRCSFCVLVWRATVVWDGMAEIYDFFGD